MDAASRQERIRVNISVTEETSRQLKALAAKEGTNVSQLITRWAKEKTAYAEDGRGFERLTVQLDNNTVERLKDWAWQNHCRDCSAALTTIIWKLKVEKGQIRGQMNLFDGGFV